MGFAWRRGAKAVRCSNFSNIILQDSNKKKKVTLSLRRLGGISLIPACPNKGQEKLISSTKLRGMAISKLRAYLSGCLGGPEEEADATRKSLDQEVCSGSWRQVSKQQI